MSIKELTEEEKAIARGDFIEGEEPELEEEEGQLEEEELSEEEADVETEEEDTEAEEDEEDGTEEEFSEEDEEEEEEDEPEEEPEEQPRIPKSRLDKEIAKKKKALEEKEEAERRYIKLLEELAAKNEAQQKVEPEPEPEPFDFDKAEAEYQEKFLDGDLAAANKIRAEIRKAEREELLRELQGSIPDVQEETSRTLAERDFQAVVEDHISKNPILDQNSDEYDEELVEEINMLMAGYVQKGSDKITALNRAVERLVGVSKKTSAPKLGKDLNREKQSLKKAVRASKAQPKKLRNSKTGAVSPDDINVKRMTEKEWRSLDPKLKRELRGDVL